MENLKTDRVKRRLQPVKINMNHPIVTFNWCLDGTNFSDRLITSPVFPVNVDNRHPRGFEDKITSQNLWFLKLKKHEKNTACSFESYDLSVCLTWAKPQCYFWTELTLELKPQGSANERYFSIPSQKILFHITFNPVWTMKGFILFKKFRDLDPHESLGLLQITCRMTIRTEECSIIYTNPRGVPEFEKMFINKEFSDFTVSTVNKEFNVHRAILASRSEVFAAMFQNEMKEKREGLMKITDFDDKVVEEFLRFIYCGKIEDLEKLSEDLLKIADKYSVQELKIICLEELCKKINTENAFEILSLTVYHKVDHLKKYVINFIVMNLKKIDESHFKSLDSDLMLDIFLKTKNLIL